MVASAIGAIYGRLSKRTRLLRKVRWVLSKCPRYMSVAHFRNILLMVHSIMYMHVIVCRAFHLYAPRKVGHNPSNLS